MFGFGKSKAKQTKIAEDQKTRTEYQSRVLTAVCYLSGFELTNEWILSRFPDSVKAIDSHLTYGHDFRVAATYVMASILSRQGELLCHSEPEEAAKLLSAIREGVKEGAEKMPTRHGRCIVSALGVGDGWVETKKIDRGLYDILASEAVGSLAGQSGEERRERRVTRALDGAFQSKE